MLILLGAGGHAKVVIEALRSAGMEPDLCLDPDRSLKGKTVEGVQVGGGDDVLGGHPPKKTSLVIGLGAPRSPTRRRRLFEELRGRGYAFPVVQAASAVVAKSASLGAGAQVLTRAVVHPGAVVGENAIVNTAAVVEHDCRVGPHCHVAPGAILCGGAVLGAGAFVGAGSVVLPGVEVGAGAMVAAGVTVRRDVPAGGRLLPFKRAAAR